MFKTLTVRTRLLLILTAACLAVLTVGVMGLVNGYRAQLEIDHVYLGGADKMEQIAQIEGVIFEKLEGVLYRVIAGTVDPAQASRTIANVDNELEQKWREYKDSESYLSTEAELAQQALVQKIDQSLEMLQNTIPHVQEILQTQNREQLSAYITKDLYGVLGPLTHMLEQIGELHVKDTKADYATAIKNAAWYQWTTLAVLVLSFLVLIPLTIFTVRGIVRPIEYAVRCIAASQDITTSLSHLSSGASETASAVNETTTTIEELKQTANVSVEKAKDVLTNTEDTVTAVNSSENSVSATLDDINQIRDRMQVISDSILKLSEKSLAIAQIMDTVSDIAEQSNLLAVNAAIEAAKAKSEEIGRSFSVIAEEIRSLAEQSKSATVQVRSLLNEIQNATNAAVLATEQGSKAVAKGVDQSMQTSKTIKELATKMSCVTQAANQIVLSNQQQLVGTEQITVAARQINEATREHLDHLRQIETSISQLSAVGETLQDMMDRGSRHEKGADEFRISSIIK